MTVALTSLDVSPIQDKIMESLSGVSQALNACGLQAFPRYTYGKQFRSYHVTINEDFILDFGVSVNTDKYVIQFDFSGVSGQIYWPDTRDGATYEASCPEEVEVAIYLFCKQFVKALFV